MSNLESAYNEKKQANAKSKSCIYKLFGVIFFSTLIIYLDSFHRVQLDVSDSPSLLGWNVIGLHFHSANSQKRRTQHIGCRSPIIIYVLIYICYLSIDDALNFEFKDPLVIRLIVFSCTC